MKLKLLLIGLFALLLLSIVQAANVTQGLEIVDIDFTVDGKTDSGVTDGTKVRKDIKPESTVKAKVTVRNKYTTSDNVDIEDVTITGTIVGIDDDEDIDDEDEISKVRSDDEKSVTLNYDIPLKVDEGTYDFDLEVEVGDDNGTSYTLTWTVSLEVNKETHNLVIRTAELSKNDLECARKTTLNVLATNLGEDDEQDSVLEIKNEELGIAVKDTFDFSGDPFDDENDYRKAVLINLAETFLVGTYPIKINIYRDQDKLEDSKTVDLVVLECKKEVPKPEEPKPQAAVCGNGVVETGEACDDKNLLNGDGCSSACQVEQIVQPPVINQPSLTPVSFEEEANFWDKYGLWVLGASSIVLFVLFIVILIVVFTTTKKSKEY